MADESLDDFLREGQAGLVPPTESVGSGRGGRAAHPFDLELFW